VKKVSFLFQRGCRVIVRIVKVPEICPMDGGNVGNRGCPMRLLLYYIMPCFHLHQPDQSVCRYTIYHVVITENIEDSGLSGK
jgi:hypothetical protein